VAIAIDAEIAKATAEEQLESDGLTGAGTFQDGGEG
jgi:hypothetical protein